MATEIVMPQMGYDMTEGTVVKWLKREGDAVKRNEVIAEIETDKATVEMESEAAGVLRKIVVAEGGTVPVGQVIAFVGSADEAIPDATPESGAAGKASTPAPAKAAAEDGAPKAKQSPPTEASESALKVSPVARRIADERGVDLQQVTGTGPKGRIVKDDVLKFAEQRPAPVGAPLAAPAAAPATESAAPAAKPAAPPRQQGLRVGFAPRVPSDDGKIPLGRMGQAIARRTQQTKAEAPHFYITMHVDMQRAADFRRELNDSLGSSGRVSLNDIIIKACAVALAKYPVFNATFQDDHLQVQPHVNVGVAVALPEGLVVPAVLECERKSLVQIAADARDLAERTRSGSLKQEEYSGTFSVSNLGMFDVDEFSAIIVSPQVSVLAVGAVRPTPVVKDGQVVVRQIMASTLSTDHRAANGAEAAQFLGEIKKLLENPLLLVARG